MQKADVEAQGMTAQTCAGLDRNGRLAEAICPRGHAGVGGATVSAPTVAQHMPAQ